MLEVMHFCCKAHARETGPLGSAVMQRNAPARGRRSGEEARKRSHQARPAPQAATARLILLNLDDTSRTLHLQPSTSYLALQEYFKTQRLVLIVE